MENPIYSQVVPNEELTTIRLKSTPFAKFCRMKNLNSDSDNANGKNAKSGPENIGVPIDKTTSPEQLAANRRNAQKSTGPKTPEGRAVSKMNALKHGIFSKEVLVSGLNIKESRRELEELYERFWQQYGPVGPVEEMLVDQIVTAQWRLRRVLRAESGEIALNVDDGAWQRSRPNLQLQVMRWDLAGDAVHAMQDSAMGNRTLAGWLREVRAHLVKDGELTSADVQRFVFHGNPNIMSKKMEALRVRLSPNSESADDAARRAEAKKEALGFIDRELNMVEWAQGHCQKREDAEEEARQAAAVLPSPEVLDKIMRYETTLQRQMYRALAQLERMQRMRQGEAVSAPIMMEVSERA